MGYDIDYEGLIRVDPPLTANEIRVLNEFCDTRQHEADDINGVVPGLPGYWCPWSATDDGHLVPPAYPCRSGMLPEWLVWLSDYLAGTVDRPELSGIGSGRTVYGKVLGFGRAPGDEFRIVAAADGVHVQRARMPCPACWVNCKQMVPPSATHRFTHPEPEGNLDDVTSERHGELLDKYEALCLSGAFVPVETRVDAVWPMPPGSPPPIPPFQVAFSELLAGTDLPQPEMQAKIQMPQ